jgi:hypothetical protein
MPVDFDCQSIVGMVYPCPNITVWMSYVSPHVSDQYPADVQFEITDLDIYIIDSNQGRGRPRGVHPTFAISTITQTFSL